MPSLRRAWILAVNANLPTRCTRAISAHFGKQSLAGRRAAAATPFTCGVIEPPRLRAQSFPSTPHVAPCIAFRVAAGACMGPTNPTRSVMHRRELLTTFATAGATAAATMASGEPTLAADDNAAVPESTALVYRRP